MKYLLNAVVMAGLAVYAAAFYAVPLPSVLDKAGEPLLRWELLSQIILLPEDWLIAAWFGNPMSFSLFDRLPVLLTAGAILVWAYVLGRMIFRLFVGGDSCRQPGPENHRRLETPPTNKQFTHPETFVFSMGAGLAALSTWTLIMGLFGVLDRVWTVAVPAGATLLAALLVWFRNIKPRPLAVNSLLEKGATAGLSSSAREKTPENTAGQASSGTHATNGNKSPTPPRDEMLGPRWLWWAVPFVAAIMLAAMLPPVDFDVREYHLQAPKEFFQQGQITFLPHNVYANMPLGAEMFALLAMVISGDWWLGALAGKTVIAAFTPLCALGLYAAGRRCFSTTAGVAAALVYISIPWVVGLSASGLIEGTTACYAFLAVYALLISSPLKKGATAGLSSSAYEKTPENTAGQASSGTQTHRNQLFQRAVRTDRSAAMSGFFVGAAVATKYPAVLFVLVPLGVWVAIVGFNSRRLTASGEEDTTPFRRLLASGYCLTLFLLAAAVCCGPWFGKNWALAGNPTYPLLYETFDGKTWNEEKNHRWNEAHRPADFTPQALGKDVGAVCMTSEWLSPLVVPLAALALLGLFSGTKPLAASRTIIWSLFAYFVFVIVAWWLFTHRIDRFWFPVLPVMALLAGAGACWCAARWWWGLLRAMIIFGLSANFLVASSAVWYNAWFVPLNFLRDDSRLIDPWHWYLDVRSTGGKVLAVGDAAVFDFHSPVFYSTCFDDCIFERLVEGKTSAEVLEELRSREIEFVYVHWGEIARYRSKGNYGFTDFVRPEVFDRLVGDGVLEPLPPMEGHSGRAYRVAK